MPDPMLLREVAPPSGAPANPPLPVPAPGPEPLVTTGSVLPRAAPVARRRPRSWGRWVLAGLGLAIAAALVVALLPKSVPVDVERVGRGPMQVTVEEDGRTRVRDRYEIAAPVAGTLLRVAARAGDSVRRGEVLGRIVPLAAPLLDARTRVEAEARVRGAEAALQQAKTAVVRAQDAYGFAARDAQRQRTLETAGATATQAREQAELLARSRSEELTAARSGVRVAESELALYRASLARLLGQTPHAASVVELRAPTDGVVLSVLRESEGPVQPGQAILAIGDPRALEIVVDLLTPDAALVRPGAPVRIMRWGGPDTLRGHVRRVEPAAYTKLSALGVEEQRVDVIIDLDDPADRWSSLGEGYRVEASILIWSGADVVTVPASAPFRHGGSWAVYAIERGRARLVPIDVGHHTDALVEIASGLQVGDRVIAFPGEQVRDGVRVRQRT
ncbi:MAG TPA: HlyD family efflux transporter periplasmic adaptor subunit [Gemmatimonadales bacterium]|nr:HlyD family efflux transporter periplasmic adaptor subunit [Gemmatimonadales bacterium]